MVPIIQSHRQGSGGVFECRGILVEVIAGEGGEDSKLFAKQLFEAYLVYFQRNKLKGQIQEDGPSKWSFVCEDLRAESIFDAEMGGHCVQRIPSNGKGCKHTSYVTVTVAQLKVQTAQMKEADLEETMQRGSQGAGGQNANKVNSAVRLRHRPTGLEVFINGRDQHHNRNTARAALAGKIASYLQSQETRAIYSGAGRGLKIRTYNLQDSRVTDHRNGAKCHRPELILKEGRFELLR